MADPILRCEGLTAYYDSEPVLNDINLSIPRSKFVLMVGPNGSGKTTFLRILRGLHRQFGIKVRGQVSFYGSTVTDKRPQDLAEEIGIVFQRPSLQLLNLSVVEEVQIGLVFRGFQWDTVVRKADESTKRFGLEDIRHSRVFELSAGQQARTVVAAILSLAPSVLLLDEPGSYFDPRSKAELLSDLKSLTEHGVTVIITSHRMEDELRFADNVVVLSQGHVLAQGEPEDVVFRESVSKLLPPRGFLSVSKILWENKILSRKILDPSLLQIKISPVGRAQFVSKKHENIVEISSITVRYPNAIRALDDISASLVDKCINIIVGPNGSGKTTLAKACIGIVKPPKGSIRFQGRDLRGLGKYLTSKLIAYCPSDPTDILFERTVEDELRFGLDQCSLHSDFAFHEIVRRLGLGDLLDHDPESLSMGQQKRLTIAIALARSPRLLILDEPTIGLDSNSVESLITVLGELRKRISIVIITHDLNVFLPLSDHLIAVEAGKLVVEGEPREIFTEALAARLHLKLPELWDAWKAHPQAKTWKELAGEVLRTYGRAMDS